MDYSAEFSRKKFEITLDRIQEMNKEQLFLYKRGFATQMSFMSRLRFLRLSIQREFRIERETTGFGLSVWLSAYLQSGWASWEHALLFQTR